MRAECPSPVVVKGPVVIGFFAPAAGNASQETDDEAQADFEYYAGRVGDPLRKLGIEFCEVNARSFRVQIGKQTRLIPVTKFGVGYYLIAADKKPRVLQGVETDTDLIAAAKSYFGTP